jgi:manganese-dependent ADP-ribose/CDP-alcohol diphosphatase
MRVIISIFFALLFVRTMPDKFGTTGSIPEGQDQIPLFSFGLLADIQYCDCDPAGTRFYRNSLAKLQEAVRSFRIDSPAFVINLGDMIEKDFVSYKPVFRVLDTAGVKIYQVTGNHDFSVEPRLKKRIPPLQSNKEGYYSFAYGKFRFIILNGNEVSTYFSTNKSIIKQASDYITKIRSEGDVNGMDWNGGMSSKQILWLSNQLNYASKNDEKVFIMCHFPVYPVNEHNLLNYKDLLTVLEGYTNIIAWFNGHNHAGNYGNFNMIHFITMRGMVETEESNSFALVEVYKNKIWIKGSGREKSQILAY